MVVFEHVSKDLGTRSCHGISDLRVIRVWAYVVLVTEPHHIKLQWVGNTSTRVTYLEETGYGLKKMKRRDLGGAWDREDPVV